jgi:large subunit ribosomal protein L24
MSRRFGELFKHWKILRGDKVRALRVTALKASLTSPGFRAQVKIIAGKDKGQVGTVARVLRDQNRVVVEGFNLVRFCAAPRAFRDPYS